jgi:hypothetical protein
MDDEKDGGSFSSKIEGLFAKWIKSRVAARRGHRCSEFSRASNREQALINPDGSCPILKSLYIWSCPRLKWENGLVLPSSLQKLQLRDCGCGYFFVRCLENLTSLDSLEMTNCKHIEYIPHDLWSSNLKSLQKLSICGCEDHWWTRSDCTHTNSVHSRLPKVEGSTTAPCIMVE